MLKKIFGTLLTILISTVFAQAQTQMADTMRSEGKIYVVVAVLATIFAGIFVYLIMLDRKITRIEKEHK